MLIILAARFLAVISYFNAQKNGQGELASR